VLAYRLYANSVCDITALLQLPLPVWRYVSVTSLALAGSGQAILREPTATHPSALFGDPPCNPLVEHKANDKTDDLRKEAANASLDDGDGHAIAETEQRHYASPVDVAVAEQPATSTTQRLSLRYRLPLLLPVTEAFLGWKKCLATEKKSKTNVKVKWKKVRNKNKRVYVCMYVSFTSRSSAHKANRQANEPADRQKQTTSTN